MNKVEQYIKKQNKIILEDREKTLIALGLTDKEYSPHNKKSWEYSECDYVNGEKRRYNFTAWGRFFELCEVCRKIFLSQYEELCR